MTVFLCKGEDRLTDTYAVKEKILFYPYIVVEKCERYCSTKNYFFFLNMYVWKSDNFWNKNVKKFEPLSFTHFWNFIWSYLFIWSFICRFNDLSDRVCFRNLIEMHSYCFGHPTYTFPIYDQNSLRPHIVAFSPHFYN